MWREDVVEAVDADGVWWMLGINGEDVDVVEETEDGWKKRDILVNNAWRQ